MNAEPTRQYISEFKTNLGVVRVHASDEGVTEIRFYDSSLGKQPKVEENQHTKQAVEQLKQYFAKQRQQFSLTLAPIGTPFQQRVWQQLQTIPFGETASYLDIATALNKPTACRAVGAANGKNPISIVVPCHRIIGANGKLTGYAGGLERKAALLALEK